MEEEVNELIIPNFGIVDETPEFQWVQLPNGEPAAIMAMYDVLGELTQDNNLAVRLVCVDRFDRINSINVTQEVINKEVILQ